MSRPLFGPLIIRLLLGAGLLCGAAGAFADEPAAAATAASNLPSQELTPQIVYELLLSEIAGARGNLDVAVQGYLDLARKTRDPRIARRASEIALFARRGPEALEAARLWNTLEPDSEAALQMLTGLLAGGMGKLEEIEPQLSRLLARPDGALPAMLMNLNRTLARYPEKSEVRSTIDRLTVPYLKLPEARFARAHAAFTAGDKAGAISELDHALALREDWEPAALLKAQLLQQDGKTKLAIQVLHDFVASHPEATNIRHAYARLLAADQQYPASRAEFERLVKEAPDNGEIAYTYALLLAQAGDLAAAEARLKQALQKGIPEPDTAKMQLGQLYEQQHRDAEAISTFRSVEGAQRTTAQARAALIQARGGDLAGARTQLQEMRKSNPKEASTFLLVEAQVLRELDKPQEAFDLLDAAIKKQPEQTDLLYDYALLAERIKRMDVMEKSLRKLIKARPDDAQAYNALGYSLADRNLRLDEALGYIRKALELSPDDAFILDSLGWALYRRGDLPQALSNLQKAYATRPDPEIAAHLGEVLWAMGKKDEAHRTWQESLSKYPKNEELARAIKRFEP